MKFIPSSTAWGKNKPNKDGFVSIGFLKLNVQFSFIFHF